MRILIAEDDKISRLMLEAMLLKWGYEVVIACNGRQAWEVLKSDHAPQLAILDWMMPEFDGVEVCRLVRDLEAPTPPYLIILTSRDSTQDIVTGLEAGANDYLNKPFNHNELRARIRVGERVVKLQSALAERISSLEDAVSHIKKLQGILPICMYCHKIRNDQESWQRIEQYLIEHADVHFSHGLCPECLEKYYPENEKEKEKADETPDTQNGKLNI